LSYTTAAIVLLIAIFFTRQPVAGLAPNAYFWMTLIALIPQLIGHSAYNYALGYLSAAYVSLTILGEPILSTVFAALFLAEMPTGGQVLGGAVVLFALVMASREESRSVRQVEQEAAITELVET
jgi:drug/metabolite transporter (DMT)-like permease